MSTEILMFDAAGAATTDANRAVRVDRLTIDNGRIIKREWFYADQSVTKGGPGSGFHGHKGRPGEIGGSLPGEVTEPATVGVTSNRPEKPRTQQEVITDSDTLVADLEGQGAEVLKIDPATGAWVDSEAQGAPGTEPSLGLTIRGTDAQILPALARYGEKWNQDAVLVMRPAPVSDAGADKNWHWDFGRVFTAEDVADISTAAVETGLLGWTVNAKAGTVFVQTIPEYQPAGDTHTAAERLDTLFARAGMSPKLTTSQTRVTLLKKEDYGRFLKAAWAEATRSDTGRTKGYGSADYARRKPKGRHRNRYFHSKSAEEAEVIKGGPGSGHHEHEGRPGQRGGSEPGPGDGVGPTNAAGQGTGPPTAAGAAAQQATAEADAERQRREQAALRAAEGTKEIATGTIPLDRLNDPQSPETLQAIYGRFGDVEPGQDTMQELKIYDLSRLVSDPAPTQKMLDDLGFTVEEFAFHNDPEAGVEFRVPNLKKQGYDEGTLWIYNPKVAHGSFEDEEYTRQWRTYHEAGHAITEALMQQKYGDSKREGRLGVEGEGVRGNPAKRTVPVPLAPLTLAHAQRAVEWEDVAFRAQRILLKDYGGVQINEDAFAREHNVNIADATFRVLTGDFGDPGHYGFKPSNERAKTRDLLTFLQNQEGAIATEQGRTPTAGVNLATWQPVTDSQIREYIQTRARLKWAGEITNVILRAMDSVAFKGGPGSGFHGHKGRPGEVGGSQAGDGAPAAAQEGENPYAAHAPDIHSGLGKEQFEEAVKRGEELAGDVKGAIGGGVIKVLRKELETRGMSPEAIGQYIALLNDWAHGGLDGVETLRAVAHTVYGGDVWGSGGQGLLSEGEITELASTPRSSKGTMSNTDLVTAMGIHAGITHGLIRNTGGYDAATDTYTLLRGYRVPTFDHNVGDEFTIENGALSSYTDRGIIARNFSYPAGDHSGVMIEVKVPVKSIFADHGDIDQGGEGEHVVFAGNLTAKVLRIMKPGDDAPKKKGDTPFKIDEDPKNREWIKELRKEQKQKGGPGSGHHGHEGRPGERGGSTPGSGGGQSAAAAHEGENPYTPSQEDLEALPPEEREALLKKAMQKPQFEHVEELGGGIRTTATADLVGFGKVKLKINDESIDDNSMESDNEVAATIINQELGNLVPELPAVTKYRMPYEVKDELRSFAGEDILVSEFRNGMIDVDPYKLPLSGVSHVALFDTVIGSRDGHPGNYVTDNKRLIPIDLGLSMYPFDDPDANFISSNAVNARGAYNTESSTLTGSERKLLLGFQGRRRAVNARLSEYVSDQAINNMWGRVDNLLKSGKVAL
jgi:hypothetical protein